MKEGELGEIFLKHLVIAVTWASIFLIVVFIVAVGIKQQVKEGIQYATMQTIAQSADFAFHPQLVKAVKQNIKEGIEFVGKTARIETKILLHDPQVKKDLKEIVGSSVRQKQ